MENIIYEEKRISVGISIILGIFTSAVAFLLVYQLMSGPVGTKPAPNLYLSIFVAVFFLLTLNFSFFRVRLTGEGVSANYGIVRISRSWKDIIQCEEDELNYFYGWGIRFGRYKKQWVWIYNVMGGPRVVFLTGKSKPKGLIISTKNPQEIIRIAKTHIK